MISVQVVLVLVLVFGWGWDVAKMIFVLFARSVSQLGIEMIWVRVFRRWVY